MSVSAQQQKIRRIVWTAAIGAITATGVWYGAGLKTRSEWKQVAEERREATPAEKIAQLQEHRGGLVAKKLALEKKIRDLEMRANGATREESIQGEERRR